MDFTSPIPNNSLVFLAAYTEDGQMDQILQAKRVDGRWKFSLDAAEADTSYKGFVLSDIRSPLRGALMLLE